MFRIAELKKENAHLKAILVDFLPSIMDGNFSSQLLKDNISSKQLQSKVFNTMNAIVNATNPDDDGRWKKDDDTASSSDEDEDMDVRGPYMTICGRLIIFKNQIRELKEENQKLKHKMVMREIKQAVDIKQ